MLDVTDESWPRPPAVKKVYRCDQCQEEYIGDSLLRQHRFLRHNIRDEKEPKNMMPTRIDNTGGNLTCRR